VYTIAGKHDADTATTHFTNSLFEKLGMADDTLQFAYVYNYLFIVVPFFFGLHFAYVDRKTFTERLTTKFYKCNWLKLSVKEILLVLLLATLMAVFVAISAWFLIQEGQHMLFAYLIVYGALVGLLLVVHLVGVFNKRFGLYPSHYLIAIILIPLTRFLNPLSAISQAFLFGIFVAGVARLGFSWLFEETEYAEWKELYGNWLNRGETEASFEVSFTEYAESEGGASELFMGKVGRIN